MLTSPDTSSSPSSRQDFLPADIQTQFAVSRELIRNIYNSFYKLRDRAGRIASRAIDNAADLLIFGKELRQVAGQVVQGRVGWSGASAWHAGLGVDGPACPTAPPHSDLLHSKRGRRGLGKWEMGGTTEEKGGECRQRSSQTAMLAAVPQGLR